SNLDEILALAVRLVYRPASAASAAAVAPVVLVPRAVAAIAVSPVTPAVALAMAAARTGKSRARPAGPRALAVPPAASGLGAPVGLALAGAHRIFRRQLDGNVLPLAGQHLQRRGEQLDGIVLFNELHGQPLVRADFFPAAAKRLQQTLGDEALLAFDRLRQGRKRLARDAVPRHLFDKPQMVHFARRDEGPGRAFASGAARPADAV